MSLKKQYKEQLIAIIHSYLPGAKIYLFGSRATRKEKEGSDIDIAIDIGKKIDHTIYLKIVGEIAESNIPMEVDVVDFLEANEKLKNDIVREGIIWTN